MNTLANPPGKSGAGRPIQPLQPVKEFKKFLVPIDFSPSSRTALRYVASYARVHQGDVILLAVVPNDRTTYEYGEIEAITRRESQIRQCQQDLAKLAENALPGTAHREIVRVGRPFEEIVLAAEALDSDLIIISRHGLDGNIQTGLGSTAERVVRYATCPVLVVTESPEDVSLPRPNGG